MERAIEQYAAFLDDRAAQDLCRSLRPALRVDGDRVALDGRVLRVFCGNNYLGLADDPRVTEAARRAIDKWGWGAGASRLISGTTTLHHELEQKLAAFKRTEAALAFGSGYLANLAAVRGLAGPGDVVLLDKLNHASLIDAARSSGADVRAYPHKHYARLERLLQRYKGARRRVIVTDSVFSMDGDTADLGELAALRDRYDALLLVDEAHATGVLGDNGRGLAELQGVEEHVDVSVGTLSKALGGIGGFVAGPKIFIDYLVNTAGSFIYTTAPPPASCAAALAALELVEREPERRAKVLDLASHLRESLRARLGLEVETTTQIVPVVLGDASAATRVSRDLQEAGFWVPAIRPPTVPRGGSRLRVTVTATMSSRDVDDFTDALAAAWR